MGRKKPEKIPPSQKIEVFLDFLQEASEQYKEAREAVSVEDKSLQDHLHDVEFAANAAEQREADRRLRESRRNRRRNKDRVQEVELVHNFFQEPQNRKTLNGLRQLLGNQRKREAYLYGERHYKHRVQDEHSIKEKETGDEKDQVVTDQRTR